MIDQALIDKATELILGGAMYKDVAAELHVSKVTVSLWYKKGLIPPAPSKKKNQQPWQGQVRGAPASPDRQPTPGRVAHHRGARETRGKGGEGTYDV